MKKLLRILLKCLLFLGGFVLVSFVGLLIYIKVCSNSNTDSIMERYMDARLGIESCDYRVAYRNAAFGSLFQDPIAIQKIKLNEQGWCKIEAYIQHQVESLEIPLNTLGKAGRQLHPEVDYVGCELYMNCDKLSDGVKLLWSETKINTEDELTIINSMYSERYFVQDFWLGGHYAYLIVDVEKHIIYRRYGWI